MAEKKSAGRRIYQAISWLLLTVAIVSVWLVVRRPALPEVATSPEAAKSFDAKFDQLVDWHEHGRPGEIRLTESEVNSKLQQTFSSAGNAGMTTFEGLSVSLGADRLDAVLKVRLLGLSLYITLGGKPAVRDHELQFDLDKVKMGSMPVPASALAATLHEKLNAPEMREALLLPDFITDIRVENRELVIQSQ